MERLTILSGLDGKLPAAFLVETKGAALLLDLGEGPEPGVRPRLNDLPPLDAIIVTHAHNDHCGTLDLIAALGSPPVFATPGTWWQMQNQFPALVRAVDDHAHRGILPAHGRIEIAGVHIRTGRSGHASGGVWLHLDTAGGSLLYSGDWSRESYLLPFDIPPRAETAILDASYGDRREGLDDQLAPLAAAVEKGGVLPVPGAGRGPEMALRLADTGQVPYLCPDIAGEIDHLVTSPLSDCSSTMKQSLSRLPRQIADACFASPSDLIVCTQANADSGMASALLDQGTCNGARFRFVFSGHVPAGTPAARLLSERQAHWYGWNVHPRLQDNLWLAESIGATRVIPAFVELSQAPTLCRALGDRLSTHRQIPL